MRSEIVSNAVMHPATSSMYSREKVRVSNMSRWVRMRTADRSFWLGYGWALGTGGLNSATWGKYRCSLRGHRIWPSLKKKPRSWHTLSLLEKFEKKDMAPWVVGMWRILRYRATRG